MSSKTVLSKITERVLKALSREGLVVERDQDLVRVRSSSSPHAPAAEVLLPTGHPLDGKALKQLASFASVHHPAGGEVRQAFATPDFHPGSVVPVGCVLATSEDLVIPGAIGTDIYCGMRLHVADLSVDELMKRHEEWGWWLKRRNWAFGNPIRQPVSTRSCVQFASYKSLRVSRPRRRRNFRKVPFRKQDVVSLDFVSRLPF